MQGIELDNLQFEVSYFDVCIDVLAPIIAEYTYAVSSSRVNAWLVDFYMTLQTVNKYMQAGYWPQTMFGCTGYLGRPCKYLDICEEQEPEEIQRALLSGQMPPKSSHDFKAQYVMRLDAPKNLFG